MNPLHRSFIERAFGTKWKTREVSQDLNWSPEELQELNHFYMFADYISYLTEQTVPGYITEQVDGGSMEEPKKVSWNTIKQGFDQAKGGAWQGGLKASRDALGLGGRSLFGAQGSNPKLAKENINVPSFQTIGLSLSPANESGRVNTCSCATDECRAACLNKAGRGAMTGVQKARLQKTNMMIDRPKESVTVLHHEIAAHEKSATKAGKRAAVRLNVVSDLPWEKLHPEIFTDHPKTQFYDYTKIAGRVLHPDGSPKQLPSNYHLTFSSTGISGKDNNWDHAKKHLNNGGTVAMVFNARAGVSGKKVQRAGEPLPSHVIDQETGKKFRVIDGDEHDHRHLDKTYHDISPDEGVIAGLRLKGGKKMLAKAGDFAVKMPDNKGTPVVVPATQKQSSISLPQLNPNNISENTSWISDWVGDRFRQKYLNEESINAPHPIETHMINHASDFMSENMPRHNNSSYGKFDYWKRMFNKNAPKGGYKTLQQVHKIGSQFITADPDDHAVPGEDYETVGRRSHGSYDDNDPGDGDITADALDRIRGEMDEKVKEFGDHLGVNN